MLESISATHPTEFCVAVHPERELVRIAPAGELDLATAPELQSQLDELRDSGFDRIVLDLRKLTFLDSSGIALILREDRLARRNGHDFSLISGSPAIQRVLAVCGLLDHLTFQGPTARAGGAPALALQATAGAHSTRDGPS